MPVDIGFDPNWLSAINAPPPIPALRGVHALVDTGATESCIDDAVAQQLQLPIIDRRQVSGVGGLHEVNMYLAQIHIPPLKWTIYGEFAGVNLLSGGQQHVALIGRTFLHNFTMIYQGGSGSVTIFS
jgi:predicted aspartyl protease